MARSRTAFQNALSEALGARGFAPVPIRLKGCVAAYYKRVDDGILMLPVMASSRERRFTASYYLSLSFSWPLMGGDVPYQAYRRVSHFLRADERDLLLEPEYCRPGVLDAWWRGYDRDQGTALAAVVSLTEGRFLAQEDLLVEVRRSRTLLDRIGQVDLVRSAARNLGSDGEASNTGKVPATWLEAAAVVVRAHFPTRDHPNGIASLAVDAWCCESL